MVFLIKCGVVAVVYLLFYLVMTDRNIYKDIGVQEPGTEDKWQF